MGTPEFLFLKYVTEESEEQGGIGGGLLHFLMEWGLTRNQENELREVLRKDHNGAKLGGAAQVLPEGETGSFQIVSATLSDEERTPQVVTSGKAPIMPGAKAAAASRMDKYGAQLLAATFEKNRSITDISVALNFTYKTQIPAVRGRIIYNWKRARQIYDSLGVDLDRELKSSRIKSISLLPWRIKVNRENEYKYTKEEVREAWDSLRTHKVIRLEYEETVESDERTAVIREAFFQFFLNAFGEPEEPAPIEQNESTNECGEQEACTEKVEAQQLYSINQVFKQNIYSERSDTLELNYRMTVKWPLQITGNIAEWYDHVRDNPKCVNTVILNDPNFQHRDIRFILDLDATDMFEEMVNYVTVNVRKKRKIGNDFSERVTIDKQYLQEQGIAAAMTYVRGDEDNADEYEYQTQWSIRGGQVYPANPRWTKGEWEGVTLATPIVPRTLELESDLADLQEQGITRVTAQIHYVQFGKEKETNIHISPAKGEALVDHKIFIDSDQKGYAYRLVFNHKEEGKLATDWQANIGDDYIYTTLPEEIRSGSPKEFETFKERAEDFVLSKTKDILNRFSKVLG